jgi:hypothetical protein
MCVAFALLEHPAHAALPLVDGCLETAYQDRTAPDADRMLAWDFPFASSIERCLTIRAGQSVRWDGNFSIHPLTADEGDTPNPIASPAADGSVVFSKPGLYGFRCNYHDEMRGSIQVLPALAPAAVPWSGQHGACLLGAVLGLLGAWTLRARVPEVTVERATARRATWTGGRVSSPEEMERVDLELALAVPPAERLQSMWSLVEDSLALQGIHGPTPRLQRLVGGVRPLRG